MRTIGMAILSMGIVISLTSSSVFAGLPLPDDLGERHLEGIGTEKAEKLDKLPLNLNLTKITSPDGLAFYDEFGYSVSVSPSGKYLAVGAPGYDIPFVSHSGATYYYDRGGAVYIYQKYSSGWWLKDKVSQRDVSFGWKRGEEFCFGVSVAITDNRLVVGAVKSDNIGCLKFCGNQLTQGIDYPSYDKIGQAFVFDLKEGVATWRDGLEPYLLENGSKRYSGKYSLFYTSWFGISVDISEDGNTIAVGAPYEVYPIQKIDVVIPKHAGAVYLYRYTATRLVGTKINGRAGGDYYGRNIALSPDGNLLAVSSHNSPTVDVRDIAESLQYPFLKTSIDDAPGFINELSSNSRNYLRVQRPECWALDLSEDMTLVGSYPGVESVAKNPGVVTWARGRWINSYTSILWESRKPLWPVTDRGQSVPDLVFGQSVALSSSAHNRVCDLIAVGCPDYDPLPVVPAAKYGSPGAVFIYGPHQALKDPEAPQVITLPGADNYDAFGWSVSMSKKGTVLAIGDPGAGGNPKSGHYRSGAVYIAQPLPLIPDPQPTPPNCQPVPEDYRPFENLRAFINPLLFNPWDPDPLPYDVAQRVRRIREAVEVGMSEVEELAAGDNLEAAEEMERGLRTEAALSLLDLFEGASPNIESDGIRSALEENISILNHGLEKAGAE